MSNGLRRFWMMVGAVLQCSAIVLSQQTVENTNQPANASDTTGAGAIINCGYTNPGVLVFRFQDMDQNGENKTLSDFGEYPWMVAIIKKSNASSNEWSQNDYVGAGSIIHPSVVLTTAHWIGELKPDEIKARGGEWNTSSEEELYPHQERNVKKIIKHPNYSSDLLANDVALLFLEEPYQLIDAPHIGTICIEQTQPAPGSECYGMGWGLSASKPSKILKKLKANVLSRDDCEEKMRKTRLGDSFQLHESFLCAASDDGCEGDSGASLVCPIAGQSSRYALNGVSAYRVSDPGAPCLYVSAPTFHKWVGEAVAQEDLDSSSYTY